MTDKQFARFQQFRQTQAIRDQNADILVQKSDLIIPLFLVEGCGIRRPIASLTGVDHLSVDSVAAKAGELLESGYDKVLLFGVPDLQDARASAATNPDGLVCRAIRALKTAHPTLTVMTDICICAYTDHGHCGVLQDTHINNDATLPILAEMALVHAQAGADWVAPSAMMDGQVAAIRSALDAAGYGHTQVMGYSAKFASGLYGPFRDAAGSAPSFGDRKSYQMDWRNSTQAIQEIRADLAEGAAAVMVKPAGLYLDIIAQARKEFPQERIAAYHVSGEYMMIRSAANAGLLNGPAVMREALYAIKRAGADWIITYGGELAFGTES